MGSRDHSEMCEVCRYQLGGPNDLKCLCELFGEPMPWSNNECNCYETDYDSTGVECLWCRLSALRTLAANLATAGLLCEHWNNIANNAIAWEAGRAVLWRPGCGRACPGWKAKP